MTWNCALMTAHAALPPSVPTLDHESSDFSPAFTVDGLPTIVPTIWTETEGTGCEGCVGCCAVCPWPSCEPPLKKSLKLWNKLPKRLNPPCRNPPPLPPPEALDPPLPPPPEDPPPKESLPDVPVGLLPLDWPPDGGALGVREACC